MCTVTFLPAARNGFILTSNRDEKDARKKALPPRKYTINGRSVFFPKDMEAGGTWIATGGERFTLCLLNGAYEKHLPSPPYKLSRGLVLLAFFEFPDPVSFAFGYDFKGIEPFTLVLLDSGPALLLQEIVWDGVSISITQKDAAQPHIWSSVTLYENEVVHRRREWFSDWLAKQAEFTMDAIMDFHAFGGTGDKHNDLLMNRNNEMLTVSMTSIMKSEEGIRMQYRDLAEKKDYSIRIL